MQWPDKKSEYQEIQEALFEEKQVRVFVLRDDLLHPGISGNKWRKLKYTILDAFSLKQETIVTVGGSHSNHIAAVAAAGNEFGFKTVGLIRGYEAYRENPTLKQAAQLGMDIRFFDKSEYAQLDEKHMPLLTEELGEFYFVPLGGGNKLGTKGSMEIVEDIPTETTHITVACGTGSTLAGIRLAAGKNQKVIGFPVMKNGEFIKDEVTQYQSAFGKELKPFELNIDYHFGGFGKMKPELISFINDFNDKHRIPLDGIYNGKMMFGLYELIEQNCFSKGSVITAIHTGGVQGNIGLMEKYETHLPL
ncbi:MAG: 1-aminocyclopropane-1-carboxylate deaminase [Salibacteraceae bacterium]|jgi:1-aminocyclopropane-1-carboxylate deaminase/D-cysteine desulfhydrase-like pyridoxal-dependent ACC family enzyme